MPTQAEIERGKGMMIGGFLDGRKIVGGQLYQRDQSDYPAYLKELEAAFPNYRKKIKESLPEKESDPSPLAKTNDLIEQAYQMLSTIIKECDWEAKLAYAVAIYKLVGEKTMGNVAFDDYLKLVYRFLLSRALPKPDVATYADAAYLANQILTDKFEGLFYHQQVVENQLYNYAKALQDELKDDGFDLTKTACKSSLFSTFGTGYDLMFLHVNPFELYDMLWEEQ